MMLPLADVAVRATLILAAALLTTVAMRRSAAATRHLVWTLAIVCVLVLPVLMLAVPDWKILPGSGTDDLPGGASVVVAQPASTATPMLAGAEPHAAVPYGASEIAIALWLSGTCVLLARVFTGIAAVHRLARHARPADVRSRRLLDEATAGAGVTSAIRLLVSEDVAMPMTWGSNRPLLLLPAESVHWPHERIRVVLLHELAHIQRVDWLTHAIARAAVAFHWFNPLAWHAVRAMTRERERACDDFVIARGAPATEYAQHLLEMARGDRSGAWTIAPAMARRSELEGRLLSILTPRRRQPGHFAAPAIALAAVPLVLAVAAAAPMTAPPPSPQSTVRPTPAPATTFGAEEMAASSRIARREQADRDTLVDALDDRSEDIRERAALSLAFRANADAVGPLLRALKDPSAQVREKAAMGLAFRRRPDVFAALVAAAQDVDAQVREKAVFAVSVSGDPRAIAVLAAAAQDENAQVREKAVQGLALASIPTRDTR